MHRFESGSRLQCFAQSKSPSIFSNPSPLNILFIGDIFGRPGRKTIQKVLRKYRKEFGIHLVIANAENLHHGKGVTEDNTKELTAAGVDFFTSGNHVWKDRSIIPFLDKPNFPLIRPANYPTSAPGKGYKIVEGSLMQRVLVINVMGRVFMPVQLDCPFKAVEKILKETANENISAIIVDLHAEATSEKVAFGHFLDGKVSFVVGTHTHVPTADERILENGTAYQTDVGFTGPANSVIGLETESIIENFLTQIPIKHEVAGGPTVFNATIVEIDENTRLATKIQRVQEYLPEFD